MLIDWFTVVTQIVNFLILVVLFKRFLYGPITKAMDEREKRIASQLKQAEDKKNEAEQEAIAYRNQTKALSEQRNQLLEKIHQEIEEIRQQEIEKVRSEVVKTRRQWYESLNDEKKHFLLDLQRLASEKIFNISRHALKALADTELEEKMVDQFIDRLACLNQDDLDQLAETLNKPEHIIQIQSAFDLSNESRQKLIDKIQKQIGTQKNVQFEVVPELISGISIKGYSYETSWNLDSYWNDLEASLEEALENELSGKLHELMSTNAEGVIS